MIIDQTRLVGLTPEQIYLLGVQDTIAAIPNYNPYKTDDVVGGDVVFTYCTEVIKRYLGSL